MRERCASPPDNVPEGRDKVRYPNPKSMAVSRDEAKTSTSGATRLSSTPRSHWRTSPNSTSLISAMDLPLIFEVRACSAKRVPPQSGQDTKVTARSTYSRRDRKSTRLNSSHVANSYAVLCLQH